MRSAFKGRNIMYLQIGENRHSVRRRIVYEDAVVYLSVTPKPVEVAGMIQLCRDDGFVLAEDAAESQHQPQYPAVGGGVGDLY